MLPEVNLLPKYERSESLLYNIFIIGLVLVVLLSGLLGYFYFSTTGNLEDTEERVALLNDEKVILEARINALDERETSSLPQAVAYVESYHVPTSILIDEFMVLLPEHGYLNTFTYDFNSVNIETQFETIPDSSTYLADLLESSYLNNVVINNLTTFTPSLSEEEVFAEIIEEVGNNEIPRYDADYTIQVNHQNLLEEEDEE